jgi:peptidoglycan/xylan/chitin deacetylase (PgdA/CDA1 family)
LRVLTYHGVCDNRLAGEAWIPESFVTRSAFEQQLIYIRRHATVLPLPEAVSRLKYNDLPERAVALTFDDGYANNLELALPLLEQYECPATIFIATRYVESGELFPFDRVRLLRCALRSKGTSVIPSQPLSDYRNGCIDRQLQWVDALWAEIKPIVTATQWRTLRPMSIPELSCVRSPLLEFGAHTHSHCILGNETRPRRATEMATSIQKLQNWGRAVRFFAYPNGCREDFDEQDKEVLRSEGIEAAFSMIAGCNRGGRDYLECKRYPVGLHHDLSAFAAELTGFRALIRGIVSGRFVVRRAAPAPSASTCPHSEEFSALSGSPRS